MAFECITEIPGMSQTVYDEFRNKMGFNSPTAQYPTGLISHCAGAVENGTWCIVEEWESREDFQRFCDSQPKDGPKEGMDKMVQRWFPIHHEYHSPSERQIEVKRAA
jgi:hypothetical protein